jgi:hypothetical protein
MLSFDFSAYGTGLGIFVKEVFMGLIFGSLLFNIFKGISYIVSFLQTLFRMVAGLETIEIDGESYGGDSSNGDVIIGILKNSAVSSVFFTLLGVCVVMLVVFTIVAIIKTEFTLKYTSKAPIITRALTSLANFALIPILFLAGFYGVNALLKVVDTSLGESTSTEQSLAYKCFAIMSAGANRASNDTDFYKYITDTDNDGLTWLSASDTNPFKDKTQDEVATMIDNMFAGAPSTSDESSTNAYYGLTGGTVLISYDGKTYSYAYAVVINEFSFSDRVSRQATKDEETSTSTASIYVDWNVSLFKYPSFSDGVSYYDLKQVNYFYDLSSFNYIIGLGAAVIIGWSMLSVCFMLFQRIFEMAILFLLSPIMTAVAPLDNGNAEKRLRSEFLKRLLSVIGPVFVFNLFFTIVYMFSRLSPFSSSTTVFGQVLNKVVLSLFNIMFQTIALIVGLNLLKTANSMFTSILGLDDMLGKSEDNMKKVMGTASKVGLGATAGLGLAFKGTAAMAKGTKNFGKGVGKGIGSVGSYLGGKIGMLTADNKEKNIEKKASDVQEELDKEQRIYDKSMKAGDQEAMNMSSAKMAQLKDKLGNYQKQSDSLAKYRNRDDYKIRKSKQRINELKSKSTNSLEDNIAISEEEENLKGLEQKQKETRQADNAERIKRAKAKIGASPIGVIGRGLGSAGEGFKDYMNAPLGKIMGRLGESMSGIMGDAGLQSITTGFNKEYRKSFYKSKEDISADKSKYDKKKEELEAGKEGQLSMLKKGVALEMGKEVSDEYGKLVKELSSATKDGVLSEKMAAKANLEKFETEKGITKKAEVMQASINNVSDAKHFENLDKLNAWLEEARAQARAEGVKKGEEEKLAQIDINKKSFKSMDDKLKDIKDILSSNVKSPNQKVENEEEKATTSQVIRELKDVVNGMSSMTGKFEEFLKQMKDKQ